MDKQKKIIISMAAVIVIVGTGIFFLGMKFGKGSASKEMFPGGREMFQNQDRNRNMDNRQSGQQRMNNKENATGEFINGEIIAKDEKSITVKTNNGSSKIIYFSDSTMIGKTTQGSVSDLNNGQSVMINGKSNSDGSIAAQNIQIRPGTPDQQSE